MNSTNSCQAMSQHISNMTAVKPSLLKLTNDILWSMENQNITAVLALNHSAAFDTMDHDILLQVFKNQYGIDGKVLDWYDSYLHPRSCTVDVNGSKSTS